MATRRRKTSKPTRGGGSPRNDGRITEQQHEEAMRVLRAEYYQSVRGIVADLAERIKSGDISTQDDLNDALHQAVDGSYWVIYTHANFQVLLVSDNHDAYAEDYGQPPVEGDSINWAALAFAALEQDVNEQMSAEGVGTDLEEAPRGARRFRRAPPATGDRRLGPRPGPYAPRRNRT